MVSSLAPALAARIFDESLLAPARFLLLRAPAPLVALLSLILLLIICGLLRLLRAVILGPAAVTPYRHLRHRHPTTDAWRPQPDDVVRQLLFFASGRRTTTDLLHPLALTCAGLLVAASLLPAEHVAHALATLRALKDDPLVAVALLGGTLLLQDTVKNAIAGIELTTTHVRFDKNDRVRFHSAGIPPGIVRHITSREVVLKSDDGSHTYIPAALAVSLAVSVDDDQLASPVEQSEGGSPAPRR